MSKSKGRTGAHARAKIQPPPTGAELDAAKRKDIYIQIQKILQDDAAFLVEFQPNYRSPASAKVTGAQTHGIYILNLRGATKTA